MADELLALGLQLMDVVPDELTRRQRALAYRDGLIISFLALRPLGRRNLAGLLLGSSLIKAGDRWMVSIAPEDTKTGTPIEGAWPGMLQDRLENYLAVHRPLLMALKGRCTAPVGDALWVSAHGSPLSEEMLYNIVRDRTAAAFGKAINPHLFRDAAATTLAILDPEHVRAASGVLGHRSQAITEKHYQQAQSIEAHRQFVAVLKSKPAGRR